MSNHGKITITAMKWAPPFAAGSVRDYRARWILDEVGWPYEVRLIDMPTMKSAAYREHQPFGQVPYLEEEGRPTMFESGAIVLDVAQRANKLVPSDPVQRAQVLTWSIAALNSVEPFLMNVAEVEFFIPDEDLKDKRRPGVVAMAKQRLGELEKALGDRTWLVGSEFTAADLLMSSVLRIAKGLKLLDAFPKLSRSMPRSPRVQEGARIAARRHRSPLSRRHALPDPELITPGRLPRLRPGIWRTR